MEDMEQTAMVFQKFNIEGAVHRRRLRSIPITQPAPEGQTGLPQSLQHSHGFTPCYYQQQRPRDRILG